MDKPRDYLRVSANLPYTFRIAGIGGRLMFPIGLPFEAIVFLFSPMGFFCALVLVILLILLFK